MSGVAMFIDADNVSADVIEQAVAHLLAAHGAIHVRRAYCTAEAAVKHAKLFTRLSIRPMVNLVAGKNCTDIALAVDAIDVVHALRPEVAVVVSSDSDFAPLVIRLREMGCRVLGIGQQGKTGEDSIAVYDDFIDLQHRSGRATRSAAPAAPAGRRAAAPRPARARAAEAAAAMPASVDDAAEPAAPPARKRRGTRGGRSSAAPATPSWPDEIERVLAAIPMLRDGVPFELRHAAEALRAAGLLAKNAPSTKLFKKHPEFFELTPARQPNTVQFLGAGASAM